VGAGASTTRYYLSTDGAKDTGDKLLSGARSVPALGVGASSTGTATVTVPANTALGVYYLLACADDGKVIAENNKANNCTASGSTVQVTAADLIEASVSNPPAAVAFGGSFPVTDTVTNQGGVGAGASTTRYYLSTDGAKDAGDKLLSGARSVPALGVGASSAGTATVTVPTNTALGVYYLVVCADDMKVVGETNEGNNCTASSSVTEVSP